MGESGSGPQQPNYVQCPLHLAPCLPSAAIQLNASPKPAPDLNEGSRIDPGTRIDHHDNYSGLHYGVEDASSHSEAKSPNSAKIPDLLDAHAGVRAERGCPKVLEVLSELSPQSNWELEGFGKRGGVKFDRVEAQTPSLRYATFAETVEVLPLRIAATRRRSSDSVSSE